MNKDKKFNKWWNKHYSNVLALGVKEIAHHAWIDSKTNKVK